jgi:SAM-dependent methyltransferase
MSEENFDRIAHEYDESLPPHVVEHYLVKRVRYILAHCPSGGHALDVGCGTGVLAGRLARSGFTVTGLDPSQGMLDVMAQSAPEVEGIRGEGTELPFEDKSFDLTTVVAALHHVAEPTAVRATLLEMVRVTRPGGRIVVWDHNPRNPYWRNLMARVPQDDGSERLIPEAEILDALREGGAEILSSSQLGLVPDFVPPSLLRVAQAGEHIVERVPGLRRLCAHNVILAGRR